MTRSIEGEEVNLFAIEGKQRKEKRCFLQGRRLICNQVWSQ